MSVASPAPEFAFVFWPFFALGTALLPAINRASTFPVNTVGSLKVDILIRAGVYTFAIRVNGGFREAAVVLRSLRIFSGYSTTLLGGTVDFLGAAFLSVIPRVLTRRPAALITILMLLLRTTSVCISVSFFSSYHAGFGSRSR